MTTKGESTVRRVPDFADEQEAAAFWDTHSPLDYPDDFEEVEIGRSSPSRKRGLTVKLDEATIKLLTELAAQQGIGPSTLARMWILEHLRSLPSASAAPASR
jgi:hypothetical protein